MSRQDMAQILRMLELTNCENIISKVYLDNNTCIQALIIYNHFVATCSIFSD